MYKRRSSVKVLLSLVALALLLLCSCFAERSAQVEENDESITFFDALGQKVSIKKGTVRAACLTGSFADVWTLSGGRVCAAADDAFDDFGLCREGVSNLGKTKNPNLESLIASDPDFVIASADTAADVGMKDVLFDAGIDVVYFDVDCFDDYLLMLDICTDITGRKDLYAKNGVEIKETVDGIKEEFLQKDFPSEKKTYLFLRASAGYIRAKGSDGTVLGEMLSDLGFINIADKDTALLEDLSIESIMSADPYRIFIVQVGDDRDAVQKNIKRMMEEAPAWQSLSAVKENRVHNLDKRLFNLKPNALWGEAYETLCKLVAE